MVTVSLSSHLVPLYYEKRANTTCLAKTGHVMDDIDVQVWTTESFIIVSEVVLNGCVIEQFDRRVDQLGMELGALAP